MQWRLLVSIAVLVVLVCPANGIRLEVAHLVIFGMAGCNHAVGGRPPGARSVAHKSWPPELAAPPVSGGLSLSIPWGTPLPVRS